MNKFVISVILSEIKTGKKPNCLTQIALGPETFYPQAKCFLGPQNLGCDVL